jgi:hypothetical protein
MLRLKIEFVPCAFLVPRPEKGRPPVAPYSSLDESPCQSVTRSCGTPPNSLVPRRTRDWLRGRESRVSLGGLLGPHTKSEVTGFSFSLRACISQAGCVPLFQYDRQGRRPLPEPGQDWLHPVSRYSQYSMIYPQTIRVFGGATVLGSGPLGVVPTCILRPTALDTPRCTTDASSPRAEHHKKRVPDGLLGAPSCRVPDSLLSAPLEHAFESRG